MPSTVLIVDDHPSFRATARMLLECDGWIVVGEAATGADAVAQARRLHPELILLDVNLPDTDGFAVATELRSGAAAIVLVSSREARDFGPRVTACGAAGFVSKADLSGDALRSLVPA
ncbi:MAG TPA: response regulator transcription factor [Solirubrobacteraceae bacterium]|nr:response regulator transcription factor [Solirubrobacteraceae bacterium]